TCARRWKEPSRPVHLSRGAQAAICSRPNSRGPELLLEPGAEDSSVAADRTRPRKVFDTCLSPSHSVARQWGGCARKVFGTCSRESARGGGFLPRGSPIPPPRDALPGEGL